MALAPKRKGPGRPRSQSKTAKKPAAVERKKGKRVMKRAMKQKEPIQLTLEEALARAAKLKTHRKKHSTIAFVRDWRPGYAYKLVFEGRKKRTSGNLKKKDLMKNKGGRVVSRKRHAFGKRMFKANNIGAWLQAVKETKQEMGISGFCKMKRNNSNGTDLEKALYKSVSEKWLLQKRDGWNKQLEQNGSQVRFVAVTVEEANKIEARRLGAASPESPPPPPPPLPQSWMQGGASSSSSAAPEAALLGVDVN
eukprot:gb/GFBE01011855.1/.p1 GENE.gb/GFBE01011855.1/~~gb/GFBE01011855.1/.p1  ORF type:complete len:251 (+),score=66.92 gb/GFBE01011855.1/:1-753(+)